MKIFNENLSDQFHKVFKFFLCGFLLVLIFSFLVFLSIYFSEDYQNMKLCLKVECIKEISNLIYYPFNILKYYVEIIYMLSTVAGIYFAVNGYFFNKNSTNVYNHIELMRTFSKYLEDEVVRKESVNIHSINSIKFYNFMFPDSRKGEHFLLSLDFKNVIQEINNIICINNDEVFNGSKDDFRYSKHQRKLIDVLSPLGISLEFLPRADFNNTERQIYEVLNSVVNEFSNEFVEVNIFEIDYM